MHHKPIKKKKEVKVRNSDTHRKTMPFCIHSLHRSQQPWGTWHRLYTIASKNLTRVDLFLVFNAFNLSAWLTSKEHMSSYNGNVCDMHTKLELASCRFACFNVQHSLNQFHFFNSAFGFFLTKTDSKSYISAFDCYHSPVALKIAWEMAQPKNMRNVIMIL